MSSTAGRSLPVIVCIDGSRACVDAARWAATYAARIDVPLQLVHAVPDGDWYGTARFADGGALEADLRRVGHEYLRIAAESAAAHAPDATVVTLDAHGTIADVVASTPARLIVLGSPMRSAVRDVVVGSTTRRVLEAASVPVLVRRGDPNGGDATRPIVVGVDGSPASDAAVRAAFDMARVQRSDVVAARFWGPASVATGLGANPLEWRRVHAARRAWLIGHVQKLRTGTSADVAVSYVSSDVQATRGLRTLALSSSMLVVGTRGTGPVRGALLGSVSRSLIHHCHCSVLVVPRRATATDDSHGRGLRTLVTPQSRAASSNNEREHDE